MGCRVVADGGDLLFCPLGRSETGFIPGQLGLRFQGTTFHFVFLHPIKFKCALRQSVDLWPRAVFAQLESLSDLFWIFPYLCASGRVVSLFGAVCAGDRKRRFLTPLSSTLPTARVPAHLLPDLPRKLLCISFGLCREGIYLTELFGEVNPLQVEEGNRQNKNSVWHVTGM